jgi:hypothetical protein
MTLDGFTAEAQLCRYFGRGPAPSEQSNHFSLTRTQTVCRVGLHNLRHSITLHRAP